MGQSSRRVGQSKAAAVIHSSSEAVAHIPQTERGNMSNEASKFHDALTAADLSYSGLSWSGFNIFGNRESVEEVKRLQHEVGRLRSIFFTVNCLASPNNRTLDQLWRDVDRICDIARANMPADAALTATERGET